MLNPAVRRLIRRELAQNKGRTTILFLLTFLPLTFVLTIAIGTSARPVDTSDRHFGQADAFFSSAAGPPIAVAGDPRIISWSEGRLWFAGTLLTVIDAPIGDPLLDGFGSGEVAWNDVAVQGRLPTAPGEVAVSADALADLAPLLSDDATLSWAPGELTIVGTLDGNVSERLLLFAPGSINVGTINPLQREPTTRGLIDWEGSVPREPVIDGFAQPEIGGGEFVQWVGPSGFVQTRDDLYLRPDPEPVVVSALFSLGLAVATGAIAFAAWGSSLRRRLRVVGLMASSGADRSHLTAIQAGQALLVAVAGSLAALVAATALVSSLPVSEWIGTDGDSEIPIGPTVMAVVVPVVIAVTVATLAGWWPARKAGRIPLSALLAGRTPQTARVPGGWIAGAGAVVFGLALLAASVNVRPSGDSSLRMLILGGVGLIAIALGALPMLSAVFRRVGVPQIGAALPPVPRMVARNASRHTGRSAAAVLGIGAIVAAIWTGAVDAQEYRSSNVASEQHDHAAVFGPGSAAVIIGGGSAAERSERVDRAMAVIGGTVIGPHEALAPGGPVGPTDLAVAELAALVAGSTDPLFFISASRNVGDVRRPDLDLSIIGVPDGLTASETDALDTLPGVATSAHRSISIEPSTSDPELVSQLVLLAIGFVVASIVIAMVASVVAAEVVDDLRVVGLVGAPAAFRRRFLTTQTFLFSAVGVVGGVVMGTLIRLAVDDGLPIPWHVVAGLAALPFVLAGGTAMLTSRPRRANRAPDFGMASAAP